MRLRVLLTASVVLATACGPSADGCEVDGCTQGEVCNTITGLCQAPTADGSAPLCSTSTDTWKHFARPFFANNCGSCHAGGGSPTGAPVIHIPEIDSTPGQTAAYGSFIQSVLANHTMPPVTPLDADLQQRVLSWLACEPAVSSPGN